MIGKLTTDEGLLYRRNNGLTARTFAHVPKTWRNIQEVYSKNNWAISYVNWPSHEQRLHDVQQYHVQCITYRYYCVWGVEPWSVAHSVFDLTCWNGIPVAGQCVGTTNNIYEYDTYGLSDDQAITIGVQGQWRHLQKLLQVEV